MNELIRIALGGLADVVETELRRYSREVQMATLEGHNEEALVCEEPPIESSPAVAHDPAADRVATLLAVADAEWKRPVSEPVGNAANGAARIDEYIRGSLGLGWSTAELGPTARPGIPYTRNGMFQWCGAFAAFCLGNVGLHPALRKKHLASTYRLWAWSNGNARRIAPLAIQPGDIVVMGPAGKTEGAHIAIAYAAPDGRGLVGTYEGNAGGTRPDGTKHEGVIRRTRPLPYAGIPDREYRVLFAVRPLPEDYV